MNIISSICMCLVTGMDGSYFCVSLQVRMVHLHPEPFSVDNELLTPTLKNKRTQLRKTFAADINEMYVEYREREHRLKEQLQS